MDEKKFIQYKKLDAFITKRLLSDIYPEAPQEPHLSITRDMIERTSQYKPLSKAKILDAGCGQGVALEIFTAKGASPIGITFGQDYLICKDKGFEVYEMDQSFLDFQPQFIDIIWCRHAIEHSLFPLFTLEGFHEVLRDDGILYVEVPAPSTSAFHEKNPNHYSCFTALVWASVFEKSGFQIKESMNINFTVPCGPDIYHAFWLTKN
jgi:SAM-dependent methyltransferase